MTENAALKEARLSDLETELTQSQACRAHISQVGEQVLFHYSIFVAFRKLYHKLILLVFKSLVPDCFMFTYLCKFEKQGNGRGNYETVNIMSYVTLNYNFLLFIFIFEFLD